MFMKLKILFPWLLGNLWKTNLSQRLNQQLLKHVHEITVSRSQEMLQGKQKSMKLWANTGT